MIRSAISTDLPALQQIEIAAGEPFRDIGMDAIADDPPPTLDELNDFLAAEHIWVQTDANDVPVAYALVEIVDGGAHIEQVSVHPDHARKGLGAQLIDAVTEWAADHHHDLVTLTTFVDVPWNAPYYERLGFVRLADNTLSPGLIRIRTDEQSSGLDAWPRVTMSRPARGHVSAMQKYAVQELAVHAPERTNSSSTAVGPSRSIPSDATHSSL
ncbi:MULTISPECIES: GNAT family N-acetyltransferase [unclassified Rhodococcus (in: high G+C Gram-positive bacteria)]|uniref:GNAT family N-acetyltransferase n=1 Tax=unclassified Rhodococcus (in: high G+C Gram-positive bacteria) TaxID=192944 RepID=UPI002953C9C1|nr:GNAT family N-acetyltransferase [Rhodococcus sp. IEGM 1318]MDV8003400.1 GNAT family N-acetyltransferase [Rhodococcus sp. IEGM 1318]MDZ7911116.1 GNAT family N-acetyltransferase [Rhodococcus sp. (in: high G+C Gram-positive bacteria)]